MTNYLKILIVVTVLFLGLFMTTSTLSARTAWAAPGVISGMGVTTTVPTPTQTTCAAPTSFFGLVPWYQYLPVTPTTVSNTGTTICSVAFSWGHVSQLWLIVFAIFEDLLRLAGMLAVAFIIYGGIRFITSQGEPTSTKAARGTIINALIGLAIAIIAATTVSFIANSLKVG